MKQKRLKSNPVDPFYANTVNDSQASNGATKGFRDVVSKQTPTKRAELHRDNTSISEASERMPQESQSSRTDPTHQFRLLPTESPVERVDAEGSTMGMQHIEVEAWNMTNPPAYTG